MAHSAHALSSADSRPAVHELVQDNLPLVGRLVREVLARVPAHVSRDDLTSAGMVALVVSAQAFDPARGVPFGRFASFRIRGALTDELRGMDWAPRSIRGRAREVEAVRNRLATTLRRTPRTEEIAAVMGVSIAELETLRGDLVRANVLSLQGFTPDGEAETVPEPAAGPESVVLRREVLGYLYHAIDELPERLRHVVIAYFFEQRQLKDVAAQFGVTESRISQLCAEALQLLRDGMNSQLEPSAVENRHQSARAARARAEYFAAIAHRGTVASRLAMSTRRGGMTQRSPASRLDRRSDISVPMCPPNRSTRRGRSR